MYLHQTTNEVERETDGDTSRQAGLEHAGRPCELGLLLNYLYVICLRNSAFAEWF